MAINQVKTVTEEKSFNFLPNQSSILHTIETNKITENGVNVVVDRPKKGDIMCITRYKENDVLLDADKQKVVWIDGLSIEPKQLSQKYEAVGICLALRGNKVLVRYKEEKDLPWWDSNSTLETFPNDLKFHGFYPGYLFNSVLRSSWGGGCCRAKFYDIVQNEAPSPESMDTIIGNYDEAPKPVNVTDFESNPNCQILRDNFSSYDEYFESLMPKYFVHIIENLNHLESPSLESPSTDYPTGKEWTYALEGITYTENIAGGSVTSPVFSAANYAASIDLNAPKLGKGNWWLPSPTEMMEIMRDVTYGTSFWDTKPDIVNRVLSKLNSFDSSWTMLDASTSRWTSAVCPICSTGEKLNTYVYTYSSYSDRIINLNFNSALIEFLGGSLSVCDSREFARATPITLYEI